MTLKVVFAINLMATNVQRCFFVFPGVDPNLHSSLQWMLSNDITGVLDNTFSVEHEAYGLLQTHELKKGGKEIQVNKRL